MLKPLTPRQYSISSSPLANVEFVQTPHGSGQRLVASLTYDVHDEAAWSGGDRKFHSVASRYSKVLRATLLHINFLTRRLFGALTRAIGEYVTRAIREWTSYILQERSADLMTSVTEYACILAFGNALSRD
jgi:hypothetical protein